MLRACFFLILLVKASSPSKKVKTTDEVCDLIELESRQGGRSACESFRVYVKCHFRQEKDSQDTDQELELFQERLNTVNGAGELVCPVNVMALVQDIREESRFKALEDLFRDDSDICVNTLRKANIKKEHGCDAYEQYYKCILVDLNWAQQSRQKLLAFQLRSLEDLIALKLFCRLDFKTMIRELDTNGYSYSWSQPVSYVFRDSSPRYSKNDDQACLDTFFYFYYFDYIEEKTCENFEQFLKCLMRTRHLDTMTPVELNILKKGYLKLYANSAAECVLDFIALAEETKKDELWNVKGETPVGFNRIQKRCDLLSKLKAKKGMHICDAKKFYVKCLLEDTGLYTASERRLKTFEILINNRNKCFVKVMPIVREIMQENNFEEAHPKNQGKITETPPAPSMNIDTCVNQTIRELSLGLDQCDVVSNYLRCCLLELNLYHLSDDELLIFQVNFEDEMYSLGIYCDLDFESMVESLREKQGILGFSWADEEGRDVASDRLQGGKHGSSVNSNEKYGTKRRESITHDTDEVDDYIYDEDGNEPDADEESSRFFRAGQRGDKKWYDETGKIDVGSSHKKKSNERTTHQTQRRDYTETTGDESKKLVWEAMKELWAELQVDDEELEDEDRQKGESTDRKY